MSGTNPNPNPNPSPASSTQSFRAERKRQHNRLADWANRLAEWRDRLLPGEFGRLYHHIRPHSMMSHPRLRGIHRAIREAAERNVPGDLVECGTARGGCAALMGLACRARGPRGTESPTTITRKVPSGRRAVKRCG